MRATTKKRTSPLNFQWSCLFLWSTVSALGRMGMQHYRVYLLDEHRRAITAANLYCTGEQAAKERAWELADTNDVELWRCSARGTSRCPIIARIFLGDDGHVIGAVNLSCSDDDTAADTAKQLGGDHDIELWQFNSLIALFKSALVGYLVSRNGMTFDQGRDIAVLRPGWSMSSETVA